MSKEYSRAEVIQLDCQDRRSQAVDRARINVAMRDHQLNAIGYTRSDPLMSVELLKLEGRREYLEQQALSDKAELKRLHSTIEWQNAEIQDLHYHLDRLAGTPMIVCVGGGGQGKAGGHSGNDSVGFGGNGGAGGAGGRGGAGGNSHHAQSTEVKFSGVTGVGVDPAGGVWLNCPKKIDVTIGFGPAPSPAPKPLSEQVSELEKKATRLGEQLEALRGERSRLLTQLVEVSTEKNTLRGKAERRTLHLEWAKKLIEAGPQGTCCMIDQSSLELQFSDAHQAIQFQTLLCNMWRAMSRGDL
jgi:hypothetical protein